MPYPDHLYAFDARECAVRPVESGDLGHHTRLPNLRLPGADDIALEFASRGQGRRSQPDAADKAVSLSAILIAPVVDTPSVGFALPIERILSVSENTLDHLLTIPLGVDQRLVRARAATPTGLGNLA